MNTLREVLGEELTAKGWKMVPCEGGCGYQRPTPPQVDRPFWCSRCIGTAQDEAFAEDLQRMGPKFEARAREMREAEAKASAESQARWERESGPALILWLERCGMSVRDLEAEVRHVPAPLVRAVNAAQSGGRGFGLSGRAGCGKTYTLAALVRSRAESWLAKNLSAGPSLLGNTTPFDWTSWPEHVRWMRAEAARGDEGFAAVERETNRLCGVGLLVLDDLGSERMKGTYDEDWAASHLDAIIDARYDNRLPIWWSTNLGRERLAERYGERLVSRLCGDAPLIEMPDQKDRRRR